MAGVISTAAYSTLSFTGLKASAPTLTSYTYSQGCRFPSHQGRPENGNLREGFIEARSFSVASGEKIVFKNNAGFPHDNMFYEDEVPSGVDAAKISMAEEDLLNGYGDTYSVTSNEKGTCSFYCAPHLGAGMACKVTVN